MALRVPVSLVGATPSDAALIEAVPGTVSARWRLKRLVVWSDNFTNLDKWSVTDSGGNIAVAGGILTVNGDGTWGHNGLYVTAGIANGEMVFEIKHYNTYTGTGVYESVWGFHTEALLRTDKYMGGQWINWYSKSYCNWRAFLAGVGISSGNFAGGPNCANPRETDWVTYRLYCLKETTMLIRLRWTAQGGAYGATETVVADYLAALDTLTGIAKFYMYISKQTNDAANKCQYKEARILAGFSSADPYLETATEDGRTAGRQWSTEEFALRTGDSGTGFTFAFAAKETDDIGTADFSSYYTLAQLAAGALGDITGRYRRVRIKFSSDGATQREIGESTMDAVESGGGILNAYLGRRIRAA